MLGNVSFRIGWHIIVVIMIGACINPAGSNGIDSGYTLQAYSERMGQRSDAPFGSRIAFRIGL